MLFTSTAFALLYLPVVLVGFYVLGARLQPLAAVWLFGASVFFYGYWMPALTLLLVLSIAVNFGLGLRIMAARLRHDHAASRRWLMAGVAVDLGLLAYFKYADFFIANVNAALGLQVPLLQMVLPIGISFYSFTQIAYLVDTHQGKVTEANWVHYGLFVTYFPHLIAGPVLHHAQMMPQFARAETYRPNGGHLCAGLVIFVLGLSKKIILADGISPYADVMFDAADQGLFLSTPEAWLGAVAYTLQLYFDFSGYSDMAVGLSWMFNVRLPFNFDAPYRSTSISDFWRRWHVSLSTFLRDYLYIALGGNRKGPIRRYVNLAATMVLGGLWHGASWSFVAWGALHGLYLMINHAFRAVVGEAHLALLARSRTWTLLAWTMTLLAVVAAWVFFRAHTFGGATRLLLAMAGQVGASTEATVLWNSGLRLDRGLVWCLVLGAMAVLGPNSNELGTRVLSTLASEGARRVGVATLALCAAGLLLTVNSLRDAVSAFIYFNF